MMPNFWQLLAGERHATVTVHEMVEKLDAGAILGTLTVPLQTQDSLHRVIVETKRRGARLMIDVLERIADGTIDRRELDMSEAGYHSFPKPEDVKKFRGKGHRLL
jgi:methionyl-tRNA formyltransferase